MYDINVNRSSATAVEVASLWNDLAADEQDKPAETRLRIPVGRAQPTPPRREKRRRWWEPKAERRKLALGDLDRSFAKRALGALARNEDVPTASQVEDDLIELIEAKRRAERDMKRSHKAA
jgi:hypothetical protein